MFFRSKSGNGKILIIEYKRPGDKINRRTIRKVNGYADFYIGLAAHEGDIPEEDVTVTIFTASKNEKLFRELENEGLIDREDETGNSAEGIYYVRKITDLPYVIVVTDELKGDGYTAFRALSDHADEKDVEQLISAVEQETNTETRDRYMRILDLIGIKNPGLFEDLIRRHTNMGDYLMELPRPRIEKQRANDRRSDLFTYVQDGAMSIDYAAKRAGMSVADFTDSMEQAGYKVPQGTLI